MQYERQCFHVKRSPCHAFWKIPGIYPPMGDSDALIGVGSFINNDSIRFEHLLIFEQFQPSSIIFIFDFRITILELSKPFMTRGFTHACFTTCIRCVSVIDFFKLKQENKTYHKRRFIWNKSWHHYKKKFWCCTHTIFFYDTLEQKKILLLSVAHSCLNLITYVYNWMNYLLLYLSSIIFRCAILCQSSAAVNWFLLIN